MTDERFIPDHHDRIALERGWARLRMIVGQLALMAAMLGASPDAADGSLRASAARRLCRIGESIARRLLVARAMMSALPAMRPLSRAARDRLENAARRRRSLAQQAQMAAEPMAARLKLAEPLARFTARHGDERPRARSLPPSVRVAQYGVLTVITRSTHGDHARPPLRIAGAPLPDHLKPPPRDAGADAASSNAALVRRIAALQGVVDDPARHSRRMGRWIARQRAMHHGRSGPLRPGRAPGQVRDRRRRCLERQALSEVDSTARRALSTRPPRASPPP